MKTTKRQDRRSATPCPWGCAGLTGNTRRTAIHIYVWSAPSRLRKTEHPARVSALLPMPSLCVFLSIGGLILIKKEEFSMVDYSTSVLSLVPALLAIIMAITTRKVIPSLGVGIIAGGLLLHSFNPIDSIQYLWSNVIALFWRMEPSMNGTSC